MQVIVSSISRPALRPSTSLACVFLSNVDSPKRSQNDFWWFLDQIQPHYYEEVMVTGIVIATAPMGLAERLDYTAWFIPQINNWAVCDTFCASFKPKPQDLPVFWDFLMQYRSSQEEYALRFMLVMFLDHFILPEYLERVFDLLDEIKSDKYYVEMAKAWLVAELFAKFRNETLDYLQRDQLSVFAHNKAIQKPANRAVSVMMTSNCSAPSNFSYFQPSQTNIVGISKISTTWNRICNTKSTTPNAPNFFKLRVQKCLLSQPCLWWQALWSELDFSTPVVVACLVSGVTFSSVMLTLYHKNRPRYWQNYNSVLQWY